MIVGKVTKNGQHYRHIARCDVCGGLFFPVRSDARYCPPPPGSRSSPCRQKAYRQRNRQRRAAERYERQRTREICARNGLPVPPMPPTEWERRKHLVKTG